MQEIILRFVIGGVIVSVFAMLGDVFRPKSFAGLFGAAPSIALATIGLTLAHEGKHYAAMEARSMMLGAVAFFVYAAITSRLLMHRQPPALLATVAMLPVWLATSLGLWLLVVHLP